MNNGHRNIRVNLFPIFNFYMKKILLLCVGLSLLFLSSTFSAPCYGTRMPSQFQWHWGLETNVVKRRNLERNNGKFRATQGLLIGSFGITDWLCFDGGLGGGYIKYNPADAAEIDYSSSFAGAYGFRLKLYDSSKSDFKSVCGFQHISVHPHTQFVNKVKRKVIFDDWQISWIVSYNRFKIIIPYLGVKFSRGDLIEWVDGNRIRRKSEDSQMTGIAFGFDVNLGSQYWINIETRFIDEQAGSISITRAF